MIDNVKLAAALRLAADALDSEPQEMEAAPVTNVVNLPTASAMPPQEAAPPAAAGLYRVASGTADAFGDPALPGHPSLAEAIAAADCTQHQRPRPHQRWTRRPCWPKHALC